MERVESILFRENKKKLEEEGHSSCFICGSTEQIETHHMMCGYKNRENVDYKALKKMCECFDVYGYGEQMKEIEMTSVDDIRNLVNLCQGHHKRADHGIHNIPFADWLMQKVRKEQADED